MKIVQTSDKANISNSVSATFDRPANKTTYTTGDAMCASATSYMTFSNVLSKPGASFEIESVTMRDDVSALGTGLGGFQLHLFNAAFTPIADNAAFNIIAIDRPKYIGYCSLTTAIDLGDTVWSQDCNLAVRGKLAAADTNLYGQLVAMCALIPAASGDTIAVTINLKEV